MEIRAILLAAIMAAAFAQPSAAEIVEHLYQGDAIVTGRDNLAERRRGFRAALAQAVIRVTGDARLAGNRHIAPLLDHASEFVASFTYEDRKKGIQISDEQGTRDRSYYLRITFDSRKLRNALTRLGLRPWDADRPRLLALLVVEDSVGRYLLGRQSERGYGQREAFAAIAAQRGLPLILPRMDEPERRRVAVAAVAAGDAATLGWMMARYRADALLTGRMVMTKDGYWNTHWTLRHGGRNQSWAVGPTTFDRAIADGLGRSARRFAGIN